MGVAYKKNKTYLFNITSWILFVVYSFSKASNQWIGR